MVLVEIMKDFEKPGKSGQIISKFVCKCHDMSMYFHMVPPIWIFDLKKSRENILHKKYLVFGRNESRDFAPTLELY